jgi:hypothetical protein
MRSDHDAIALVAQIDQLIALSEKKIALLRELRAQFVLAQRAGVHPNEIARAGFDPLIAPRWRWREIEHGGKQPTTNYVVLKDGRRIDLENQHTPSPDRPKKEESNHV